MAGSTLGVIGDGVLGKAVADLGKAFGMRVLFSDYKGTTGMGPLYTPFEQVLRQSDMITLHTPLIPTTRNMIGAAEFAVMERRPLLINTARGGLVDEDALAEALREGRLAGAGFDVATIEPPPKDHVLMRLIEMPNFILTPHVAWASREAIQSLADQLVDNVDAFVAGMPKNIVCRRQGWERPWTKASRIQARSRESRMWKLSWPLPCQSQRRRQAGARALRRRKEGVTPFRDYDRETPLD